MPTPEKTSPDEQPWRMDQDGPLPDAYLDLPIPFRLVADHERGASLDDVDSRGMVP